MPTRSRRRRWRVLRWPGSMKAGAGRWPPIFRDAGWSVYKSTAAASLCRSYSPPGFRFGCWTHRSAARWRRSSGVVRLTYTWPTCRPPRTFREERDEYAYAERDGSRASPPAAGPDPCSPSRQGWGRGRVHPAPRLLRPTGSAERVVFGDEVRPPAPLVARDSVDSIVPTYLTAPETRRLTGLGVSPPRPVSYWRLSCIPL